MTNLPGGRYEETGNWVLVKDEGYFDTFDLEVEE